MRSQAGMRSTASLFVSSLAARPERGRSPTIKKRMSTAVVQRFAVVTIVAAGDIVCAFSCCESVVSRADVMILTLALQTR